MPEPQGWNDGDVWALKELIRKANQSQLLTVCRFAKDEINRRWEEEKQRRYDDGDEQ